MCWCKWARSKLRQVRSPCPLSLFLLPRNSSTSFLVFGLEIKGIRGKKISPVRLNIFIKTRKRGSDLFISTALKDLPRERRSRGDSAELFALHCWKADVGVSIGQQGCGNPPKLCAAPQLSSSLLRSCLIIQSGKLKAEGELCFEVNTSWLGEIV